MFMSRGASTIRVPTRLIGRTLAAQLAVLRVINALGTPHATAPIPGPAAALLWIRSARVPCRVSYHQRQRILATVPNLSATAPPWLRRPGRVAESAVFSCRLAAVAARAKRLPVRRIPEQISVSLVRLDVVQIPCRRAAHRAELIFGYESISCFPESRQPVPFFFNDF